MENLNRIGGCEMGRRARPEYDVDGCTLPPEPKFYGYKPKIDADKADAPNAALQAALARQGAVLGGRQQSGSATLKETPRPSQDRVTIEEIRRRTKEVKFYILHGTTTTICRITLDNGWTVLGSSACVDPGNFDMHLGEELAKKDAERQLWPLLGFLLQERRYRDMLAIDPAGLRKGAL